MYVSAFFPLSEISKSLAEPTSSLRLNSKPDLLLLKPIPNPTVPSGRLLCQSPFADACYPIRIGEYDET